MVLLMPTFGATKLGCIAYLSSINGAKVVIRQVIKCTLNSTPNAFFGGFDVLFLYFNNQFSL